MGPWAAQGQERSTFVPAEAGRSKWLTRGQYRPGSQPGGSRGELAGSQAQLRPAGRRVGATGVILEYLPFSRAVLRGHVRLVMPAHRSGQGGQAPGPQASGRDHDGSAGRGRA
jgi:hypothetical protein